MYDAFGMTQLALREMDAQSSRSRQAINSWKEEAAHLEQELNKANATINRQNQSLQSWME